MLALAEQTAHASVTVFAVEDKFDFNGPSESFLFSFSFPFGRQTVPARAVIGVWLLCEFAL
jgi:hypothetical protein